MIEIVASMSLPEYREVCRAIGATRRRISPTGLRVLTVVGLTLCFEATVLSPLSHLAKLELILLPYLLAGVFALYIRRAVALSYRKQKKLLQRQTMHIDETGISGEWKGGDRTYRYAWSAFEHCIEIEGGYLFLLPAAGFVRVPKAALSPEEHAQLCAWSANVPCKS
ncbi:YcxB-like protein [Granulicella rosea]|uniref:YcxB-like protein n=1 Tax=Granulicella rosea TaxID=474952 RepID=A0A239L0Q1_9BACT|nr:YcxB family protein [Granulicella rosea]SNT24136.1 YcxB-like protein [Granulicella rosea]